ncbi:RNA-binding protein, putative [Plasmodium gallinaceum]|uniref:RNA-binding protein, putative n=1 Tax=Plasmodium gallinaceum TaxID=5849 RepID=A0A1J1GSH7_PLAGA|nr:RNA-binding protein, putative [Plasmodium gallinaceum]CRG94264.1 RNA-binding protein, putative [Plasmodium gallinaceum]
MGIFDKIKSIEKINEAELKNIGQSDSSWHDQYKDSSYIYIGNLDNRLTEGDVIIVFSQYGEPIDINLVRDEETGKSKGYCFLSYADQRSTVLAVDNFNGYKLLDRPLVVDHILNYKLPNKYSSNENENEYKPTGAEGKGIGVYNVIESEINLSKAFEKIDKKCNEEKRRKLLDEDELWALKFEESIKDKYRNIKNENIKKDGLQNDNINKDEPNYNDYIKNESYEYKRKKPSNKYMEEQNIKFDMKIPRKNLYNREDKSKENKKNYECKNKNDHIKKELDKSICVYKRKSEKKENIHINKDISKEKDKYKSKNIKKNRSKDRHKHISKNRSRSKSKDKRKHKSKDKRKHKSKDRRKHKSKDRGSSENIVE